MLRTALFLSLMPVLAGGAVIAQAIVKGVVLEANKKGEFRPLVGANVYWIPSMKGVVTDTAGWFKLPYDSSASNIVVSFIGYKSDTLKPTLQREIRVILANDIQKTLKEVLIEHKAEGNFISLLDPINTRVMTEKELTKAACCNLSESFETNPSVDVTFSDGITGARQIQMLGLSGIYTQITTENIPSVKGINASYGLGYTPGPWISSIQVSKGAGSVANGHESITGQINVELRKPIGKPEKGEKLLFNGFVNSMGRHEWNLNHNLSLSKKISVATLLHVDALPLKNDMNSDGFIDLPLGSQINILQRWKYEDANGWIVQWGGRYLKDNRTSGQLDVRVGERTQPEGVFGVGIQSERIEGFAKAGYVYPEKRYKSIGVIVQTQQHSQDNFFGNAYYKANQTGVNANLIYQNIIGNTNHKYRTGLSFVSDRYEERLMGKQMSSSLFVNHFDRVETIGGAFFEYTYGGVQGLTLIAGLRTDYHNYFGYFVTPRLHGKYEFSDATQLRFSSGRGVRSANVLSENFSMLINARQFILQNRHSWGYGLDLEKAWNSGGGLIHHFQLFGRKASASADYYYTTFQNQVVVDLDLASDKVVISNLDGVSYAHSLLFEADAEPLERLKTRIAYRYLDVRTTYHSLLLTRPFIAPHRAFTNVEYTTNSRWSFDFTASWNASKRIPSTSAIPPPLRFPEQSPHFFMLHTQVSKKWSKSWETYAGVENLGNFMQHRLIVDPQNPFGSFFDASLVWGPIPGRMWYAGFRFRL
jgi:outer membrane receptor for ferrienterochelin and colicin